MAVIQAGKTVQPTTINKFLGLNLSNTGDTQIQLGESGNMTNFYITDDYKLRKMHGYKEFYQFGNPIKGMFSTKIGNTKYLFVVSNRQLYVYNGSLLNDNNEVNPEKTKLFLADGETNEFSIGSSLTSVKNLIIGEEIIDEFDDSYTNKLIFTSSTIHPGGIINTNTGKINFGTVVSGEIPEGSEENPTEGTRIRINYTYYIEPSLVTTVDITNIGSSDASFFEFNNCVYILCGEYYKFYIDGDTPKVELVEGYTPTVFINTPSGVNGGGVLYDEINMLSPKKRQTFNGEQGATDFRIAQELDTTRGDRIVSVVVNGTPLTSGYELQGSDIVHLSTGVATGGYDNVEITWSKDDGNRAIIGGMKFGTVFGGDVDTRVFLYGNSTCQNRIYFSGITFENDIATPSVEYFPATAQVDIGPANFAVTDLTRQYDRLLATTNKPEAYYMTISTEQLPVTLGDGSSTTRYVPSVSTFPLNEAHGNVAMGQGQLLINYPVTFENNSMILWKATNVRDEKNAEEISQKIKLDLDKISISLVKTLDLQEHNQLWILYENKVWIYNYNNKTFSRLSLPQIMTNICSLDGNVYMSTNDNWIIKFDESFTTYGAYDESDPNKNKIKAYWEMNFSDFGVPYLRKTMSKLWVLMQPQNWSSADISFISNRAESTVVKHIEYKKQWFDDVHFGDWHFTSSANPQPFKLKLKAKKFTNLKITIKNEEETTCTILSLVLQVESFGYSK